jgi:hypothetical protein
MTTHVTETAAAPSELAVRHFEEMLGFETIAGMCTKV